MFISVAALQLMSPPASMAEGGQHNNTATTDGKQQPTNVQRWTSNKGRMRWRTTVAEEKWWMEKQERHGNGTASTVAKCENIRNGYLYVMTQHLVILKGIYGFKFPKRFLEISSRDLTSSFPFCQS
jgi:hypothetical protein